MDKIQLEFQPTYEDYLTVSRAATYNRPTRILIIAMGLISLATIAALLLGWLAPDNSRLLFFLLPPGMFLFFLIITPINLRRKAHQTAQDSTPVAWTVTTQTITIHEEDERIQQNWDLFADLQELPEHYLLFYQTNRSAYLFLPKRAFKTPAAEAQFREWAGNNLGEIK
jgi:hypothetical protein